ncbi:MAG: hypothetical protein WAV89_12195 [Ignavibacteriaceae bacterium]
MTLKEIFNKAVNTKYLIIEENELNSLLKSSETIREVDTHLSDFIRLLKFENKLFVQEINFKKEIMLRKMESLNGAEKFINDRLDYYERKWDGCGCKIDYYE